MILTSTRIWLASVLTTASLNISAATSCGALEIHNFWVRAAPPVAKVIAAYGALKNTGSEPIRITGVSSPCCSHGMMHDTIEEDGVSRMRHRESIDLAPGDTQTLAPGGLHLMLMQPESVPKVGDSVELILQCREGEDTADVAVNATVKRQ